jgi:hypothetical protein
VIQYLHGVSPTYARKARRYYSKLGSFKDEAHEYGLSVACGLMESQQSAVVQVLTDLVRSSHQLLAQDGLVAGEELLQAKFNALVRPHGHGEGESDTTDGRGNVRTDADVLLLCSIFTWSGRARR